MGQGDNGDALKANIQFMDEIIKGDLGFVYTTPIKVKMIYLKIIKRTHFIKP
jgi:hypothetical protein